MGIVYSCALLLCTVPHKKPRRGEFASRGAPRSRFWGACFARGSLQNSLQNGLRMKGSLAIVINFDPRVRGAKLEAGPVRSARTANRRAGYTDLGGS